MLSQMRRMIKLLEKAKLEKSKPLEHSQSPPAVVSLDGPKNVLLKSDSELKKSAE